MDLLGANTHARVGSLACSHTHTKDARKMMVASNWVWLGLCLLDTAYSIVCCICVCYVDVADDALTNTDTRTLHSHRIHRRTHTSLEKKDSFMVMETVWLCGLCTRSDVHMIQCICRIIGDRLKRAN